MHRSQIDRAIAQITAVLMDYAMPEERANNRARNIVAVGTTGEQITASIVNEMLTPSEVILGIQDSTTRAKVAIEIVRHWIACTSNSASKSWMRLHLKTGMTYYKAADWLFKAGYIGVPMKSCFQNSGNRNAQYQGASLQHSIEKLKKSDLFKSAK